MTLTPAEHVAAVLMSNEACHVHEVLVPEQCLLATLNGTLVHIVVDTHWIDESVLITIEGELV